MKRIILALCLTTTAALAQDAGLYDDIASPDASLHHAPALRVIFATAIVLARGDAPERTQSSDGGQRECHWHVAASSGGEEHRDDPESRDRDAPPRATPQVQSSEAGDAQCAQR